MKTKGGKTQMSKKKRQIGKIILRVGCAILALSFVISVAASVIYNLLS